jgi:predicted transcriptional regulator
LAEKLTINPEKTKQIQQRSKERTLIIQEIKSRGASTIDELAKFTGMEKTKLFKHLVAMRQFGKVSIVGEKENQLVYGLP